MWEASLLTMPPSYVEARAQEGDETGILLKKFKTDVDRPLSAILTLNTLAHTVGAIGVGAQATNVWPGNTTITGLVVPAVMTVAILILSEIIPKTLGATYWKQLSGFTAKSLVVIIFALKPLVWLSQQITKLLKGKGHQVTMTRTDIAAMASLSEREGVIESNESLMMQNLLRSRDILVKDIMTPRTVLAFAPASQTVDDFLNDDVELQFSRIPLYEDSIDNISSYVLKDSILLAGYKGKGSSPLSEFARPLYTFDANLPMPQAFERLVGGREHIGLVIGQYGGTVGIVTQEDIIETLLGLEIVDESDDNVDMQKLAQEFRLKRQERTKTILPNEKVATRVSPAEQEAARHAEKGGSDFGLTGQTPASDM